MYWQMEHLKRLAGKIILVDKEKYEKALLEVALVKKFWQAEIEYFSNAEEALMYLKKTEDKVFLVISEMNLGGMNGLNFKKKIDADPILLKKAIPFIFASTSANNQEVKDAYDYRVQGYFKKPNTIEDHAELLDLIIRYWIHSRHPNDKVIVDADPN